MDTFQISNAPYNSCEVGLICCVPSFAVHGWESHQEELAEEGEEEAEEVGGNS